MAQRNKLQIKFKYAMHVKQCKKTINDKINHTAQYLTWLGKIAYIHKQRWSGTSIESYLYPSPNSTWAILHEPNPSPNLAQLGSLSPLFEISVRYRIKFGYLYHWNESNLDVSLFTSLTTLLQMWDYKAHFKIFLFIDAFEVMFFIAPSTMA